MIAAGKTLWRSPWTPGREILLRSVLSKLDDPIRESPELEASLPDLMRSVKAQGLEGLIAKRRDSRYEPGQRTARGGRSASTKGKTS